VHPAARAFEDHWLVADFDSTTRRFTPHSWPVDGDEGRDSLAWRAIVRGTRDYCRKNGFDKVWLGLSGGIDSALVLCIAVDALGAENVTGVRLPSRYTSGLSNDLADEQARVLGVKILEVPIEAPIKDLYKTEVFALARWRNTVAGAPVIPEAVITRPPSAELRENQTDQDSLPPYDVLDAILLRHVDQEQSRDDIVRAGFDAATVDRVLRLVRISEWKRHQSAPGPKVSRRAFGRERRYPITSGWR